jgi:hypothetical protein
MILCHHNLKLETWNPKLAPALGSLVTDQVRRPAVNLVTPPVTKFHLQPFMQFAVKHHLVPSLGEPARTEATRLGPSARVQASSPKSGSIS